MSCTQKQPSTYVIVTGSEAKGTLTWPHWKGLGASEPLAKLPGRSAGASPQTAGTARTPAPCSPCTGAWPGPAPSGTSHTFLWSTSKSRCHTMKGHCHSAWVPSGCEEASWALCHQDPHPPLSLVTISEFIGTYTYLSGGNIKPAPLGDFIRNKRREEL